MQISLSSVNNGVPKYDSKIVSAQGCKLEIGRSFNESFNIAARQIVCFNSHDANIELPKHQPSR